MIIGHQKIWDELSEKARSQRFAHAHLFLGPKHVGKTHVAIELAFLLQGAEDDASRKQILDGADADTVLFLDDGESLSIKSIRGIIERASQSHQKPRLIFIIENLERMRPEAMNALLKTLEEPGEGVVFFLIAHREEDVLPTIRSRCQLTHFHTVHDELLKAASSLEEPWIELALGRPGRLKAFEEREGSEHEEHLSKVKHFLKDPTEAHAFRLARDLEQEESLEDFLDILLQRARHCLRKEGRFLDGVSQTEKARQELQRNINKKLLIQNVLLSFT